MVKSDSLHPDGAQLAEIEHQIAAGPTNEITKAVLYSKLLDLTKLIPEGSAERARSCGCASNFI